MYTGEMVVHNHFHVVNFHIKEIIPPIYFVGVPVINDVRCTCHNIFSCVTDNNVSPLKKVYQKVCFQERIMKNTDSQCCDPACLSLSLVVPKT